MKTAYRRWAERQALSNAAYARNERRKQRRARLARLLRLSKEDS